MQFKITLTTSPQNVRATIQKITGWFPTSLLLRARNFFNDQTGHWIPACVAIGVSISCTISNIDSNSDFALVYVVTVALNPGLWLFSPVFPIHSTASIGRGSTALGAVKSDEPSLAAAATPSQMEVSLVNSTESSVILGLNDLTILQKQIKLNYLFTCLFKGTFFIP